MSSAVSTIRHHHYVVDVDGMYKQEYARLHSLELVSRTCAVKTIQKLASCLFLAAPSYTSEKDGKPPAIRQLFVLFLECNPYGNQSRSNLPTLSRLLSAVWHFHVASYQPLCEAVRRRNSSSSKSWVALPNDAWTDWYGRRDLLAPMETQASYPLYHLIHPDLQGCALILRNLVVERILELQASALSKWCDDRLPFGYDELSAGYQLGCRRDRCVCRCLLGVRCRFCCAAECFWIFQTAAVLGELSCIVEEAKDGGIGIGGVRMNGMRVKYIYALAGYSLGTTHAWLRP